MNERKIRLLAQCIVNRTLGKDVEVRVNLNSHSAYVSLDNNYFTDMNTARYFSFGYFDESEKDDEWFQIILSKHPNASTVHVILFAMLHEIGHVFAPAKLTNKVERANANTYLEYRNLPDEAFADKWASDFIAKNKLIVQLWNKQLKEAL